MLLPALGAWAPRRPSVRRLSESPVSDDCICSPSHVSAGQWLTLDFGHEVVEMSRRDNSNWLRVFTRGFRAPPTMNWGTPAMPDGAESILQTSHPAFRFKTP